MIPKLFSSKKNWIKYILIFVLETYNYWVVILLVKIVIKLKN